MGRLVIVGISDQQIATEPDVLITYALGSCVGICLRDSRNGLSGLAHILLPEAFGDSSGKNMFKFADTAIERLVLSMEKHGCGRGMLTAKIAGGANMFATSGKKHRRPQCGSGKTGIKPLENPHPGGRYRPKLRAHRGI